MAFSDSFKKVLFGSGVAHGALTICGWCQSCSASYIALPLELQDQRTLNSRYWLVDTRSPSGSDFASAKIQLYLDAPLDGASAQAVLNRQDVIFLRISDFKSIAQKIFWKFILVLVSVDDSADIHRCIGIMKRAIGPSERPEAVIDGWDLRTITIV